MKKLGLPRRLPTAIRDVVLPSSGVFWGDSFKEDPPSEPSNGSCAPTQRRECEGGGLIPVTARKAGDPCGFTALPAAAGHTFSRRSKAHLGGPRAARKAVSKILKSQRLHRVSGNNRSKGERVEDRSLFEFAVGNMSLRKQPIKGRACGGAWVVVFPQTRDRTGNNRSKGERVEDALVPASEASAIPPETTDQRESVWRIVAIDRRYPGERPGNNRSKGERVEVAPESSTRRDTNALPETTDQRESVWRRTRRAAKASSPHRKQPIKGRACGGLSSVPSATPLATMTAGNNRSKGERVEGTEPAVSVPCRGASGARKQPIKGRACGGSSTASRRRRRSGDRKQPIKGRACGGGRCPSCGAGNNRSKGERVEARVTEPPERGAGLGPGWKQPIKGRACGGRETGASRVAASCGRKQPIKGRACGGDEQDLTLPLVVSGNSRSKGERVEEPPAYAERKGNQCRRSVNRS